MFIDETAWFSKLLEECPNVELGVCDGWSFNEECRQLEIGELKEWYPGINFWSNYDKFTVNLLFDQEIAPHS